MNENEILQLIKRSVSDTKHILNDGKPFEGIKKILCSWLLTLFICNFLNSFFTHLSMTFYFYGSNVYCWIKDILTILSLVTPFVVYIISTKKTDMTIKERDYLKSFLIFPILYVFCACLPMLLKSVNPYLQFQLVFSFPFSYLVTLMALYHLNGYFKNKYLFGIMIVFVAFLLIYFIFEAYIELNQFKLFPMWVLRVDYQLQDLNEIFLIDTIFLACTCFFMTHHYIDED